MATSKIFDQLGKLPISRSGDRAPRMATAVWVTMIQPDGGKSLRAQAMNISRSGVLVRFWGMVPTIWQVGDRVALSIETDNRWFEGPVSCDAIIARLLPDMEAPEHRMLIGFKFATD